MSKQVKKILNVSFGCPIKFAWSSSYFEWLAESHQTKTKINQQLCTKHLQQCFSQAVNKVNITLSVKLWGFFVKPDSGKTKLFRKLIAIAIS